MLGKFALAAVCLALSSGQMRADPNATFYTLTDADAAMVQAGVSAKLLDPESARFTQLIAATSPPPDAAKPDECMIWVCGHVSRKNTFGGYAQPTPFLGAIVANKPLFVVISIAGPDASEQSATLQTCLSKMPDN